MFRTLLLCCAVLAVGCAKSEPPATPSAEPAAAGLTLADVAGTWEGDVMTVADDTVRAVVELTATAEATGWSMQVANAATPMERTMVPATNVVADGDSLIVEAGPFGSVLRAGQSVTTRTVYRLEAGMLVGHIYATYPATGDMVVLRTRVARKPA